MTIFAVICAGMFPGIHIGRVWVFYWLFPIPTEHLAMWPNFRSPLLWDVFAVSTYATVSVLFWYMGMVPDLATFRDRAKSKVCQDCLQGSRPWAGPDQPDTGIATKWPTPFWRHLATPLVLSVHTIVSFDFAVSQVAWLAHDDFPTVLCCRCDLQWICDGSHAAGSGSKNLRVGKSDYDSPPGKHEQDHHGDWPDGRYGIWN